MPSRLKNWLQAYFMIEDWRQGGFGIYIHWPFCQSKCPYCDFNSHVVSDVDFHQWEQAFIAEISRYASQVPDRIINSVFFGGGTPSLMPPALVKSILTAISNGWNLSNNAEITLEANPTSFEINKFRGFFDAGVNRVSIGVQALNDIDLIALGRLHSVKEAYYAIEKAQEIFERVSFDLIYARQHQTFGGWQAELSQALALGTDHLSLYQLTIEDGTAFGRRHAAGRLKGLPSDELSADLYAMTQELTRAAGLPNYEISNHARPGSESRHNLLYWNCGDYVGVGPGAHGRLTFSDQRFATETALMPADWLSNALSGDGESIRARLSTTEETEERLMMGLRLSEGVAIDRLGTLSQSPSFSIKINDLGNMGLLWMKGGRIGVSSSGRIILNAILRELLA